MTTDRIKELVKRLRIIGPTLPNDKGYSTTVPQAVAFAADALEAMAGERDRTRADYEAMKAHNKELFGKLSAAELERDRLAKSEEGLLKTLGLERREKHAAQTERDRLKAALEAIKLMPARIRENNSTSPLNKILFEAQQFVANACAAIARKALGGDAS